MKNIFVWTHHDLDGLASCLAVKWFHPDCKFDYITTTGYTFREDFTKWLLKNRISDFDTVYIVDLDISEHQDLIDEENVVIIDHHTTHVENASYEFATNTIIEYSSAAKLIYKLYKAKTNIELSTPQKTLIALADDYDSYNHEVEDSIVLNSVFYSTQNNFKTFMELYDDGFSGFTQQQINMFKIYQKDLQDTISGLKYFENKKLKIGKNPYHVIATSAKGFINNIADHILDNYSPDIAIVVNPKTKHVSFRRNSKVDVDLGRLAETIADGGGHSYASGGQITDNFLAFTKLLKPRKKMYRIEKNG